MKALAILLAAALCALGAAAEVHRGVAGGVERTAG